MAASDYLHIGVHTVSQSSPTPTISGIQDVTNFGEVSRITSGDRAHGGSNCSSDESASYKVLKDVHICQALHEEEIFAIQNEQSLIPVGWIHTHPSQSCFMSSIDLHTQYSYQIMVPEAVAIVMAPTDKSRNYGIFRLSDPTGLTVLKECQEKGFHPHGEPSDGSPIYEHCSNVYVNPNLRFEIFDLR